MSLASKILRSRLPQSFVPIAAAIMSFVTYSLSGHELTAPVIFAFVLYAPCPLHRLLMLTSLLRVPNAARCSSLTSSASHW